MSEKRKKMRAMHEAYEREQGKRVVAYVVATLILLFILVAVIAMFFFN